MNKLKYNKEKIKQALLISFSFLLIIFGYLNYKLSNSNIENIEVASRANETNLGDVELVNSDGIIDEQIENEAIVPNEEIDNAIINNGTDNYFEDTKIERDKMYSEMEETYQKLIDSDSISVEQKAIAIQEISNITKVKNGILIAENLIKNKGFEDVVIMVNNGKISVVVKYPKLSKEQVSQIQNIVEREFNANIENINISCK